MVIWELDKTEHPTDWDSNKRQLQEEKLELGLKGTSGHSGIGKTTLYIYFFKIRGYLLYNIVMVFYYIST